MRTIIIFRQMSDFINLGESGHVIQVRPTTFQERIKQILVSEEWLVLQTSSGAHIYRTSKINEILVKEEKTVTINGAPCGKVETVKGFSRRGM